MTVNTQKPPFFRPAAPVLSGQRLYLREHELDAGVEMVLKAGYALKACTQEVRDQHRINWTQARALTAILHKPQGVSALSIGLDVTKQAAIKTVEELEMRQFATRSADVRDGRRRTITLTPEGETIARDLNSALRNLLAKAYRQAGGDAVAGSDAVLNAIKSAGALR